jgi:hypothetical protein
LDAALANITESIIKNILPGTHAINAKRGLQRTQGERWAEQDGKVSRARMEAA